MLTMDDLNDSVTRAELKVTEIVENMFTQFYTPGVKREMDMTWAQLPDGARQAMRSRMPDYTKRLDDRINNRGG